MFKDLLKEVLFPGMVHDLSFVKCQLIIHRARSARSARSARPEGIIESKKRHTASNPNLGTSGGVDGAFYTSGGVTHLGKALAKYCNESTEQQYVCRYDEAYHELLRN